LLGAIEDSRRRASAATPSGTFPRSRTEPEGHMMTPAGAAWYKLRELEAVHAQKCHRCQQPFAADLGGMAEPCPHGQDLRALLRALTMVLADPVQYPRELIDCRALAVAWLGRELDPRTGEVLRARLADGTAQVLSGRAPDLAVRP
jgi:hypothetical protein